jgi:hypothetical protein
VFFADIAWLYHHRSVHRTLVEFILSRPINQSVSLHNLYSSKRVEESSIKEQKLDFFNLQRRHGIIALTSNQREF